MIGSSNLASRLHVAGYTVHTMHLHDSIEQHSWYAVQVTTRKEAVVSTILAGKGYECYVPLYPKRRMWSDRVKVTLAPVFSGYVFTRFDVRYRLPILVTQNVQGIVGAGKLPIAIPERGRPDSNSVAERYAN